MGRPSEYSQETADFICSEIADGKSLRTIALNENCPVTATIFAWLRKYPEFLTQYTCAKDEQAESLVEEILDIADNNTRDVRVINRNGVEVEIVDNDVVNRSKLRIETRKWLASKLKPKKYSDHIDLTTNGKDMFPAKIEITNPTKDESNG